MTTLTVFPSRWGYHPCDYSTYRKLNTLHALYQKALRQAHAWRRWKRKDPHNRVSRRRIRNDRGQTIGYGPPRPLPEPTLCPLFVHKAYSKCYVDKKGANHPGGFLDEIVVIDDLGIVAAYGAARKPASQADAVVPLSRGVAEIDALYEEARSLLEQQDLR
jgi:hypothetical protein